MSIRIFATPEEAELAAMTKAEEKALFRNEYEKSSGKWKLAEDFRVIDGESSEGDVFTLNDIPLQFGTVKKYKDRRVTKIIHE